MAIPGLGHKTTLRIGKESSWGGGATPTKSFEVVSWNVGPQVGVIQDGSLNNKQSRRAMYQGGYLVRGTFVVRLNYDGLAELFRAVQGGYTGTAGSGGDSAVITHVFTEAATLPSYEMQVSVGDIPTGTVFRLTGAKLINVTVRGTAGTGNDAMLMAEFTVLAKDMVSNFTATGSPSSYNPFPVLFHQASTVDDGLETLASTPATRVRSLELTLENPHAEDRFYLSSVNIDEPVRNDFLTARWRITQEFLTKTAYDAARNFTTGSPQFVFQHPTTIGTTKKREFEVRSGSAQLVEWSAPVEGYGIIIATATWEAFYDPTDLTALYIRIQNLDAALP